MDISPLEFKYGFNRRVELPDVIPDRAWAALGTLPNSDRLLESRLARQRYAGTRSRTYGPISRVNTNETSGT